MQIHRRVGNAVLAFAFGSVIGGPGVALGQSQEGGLPAVSDRVAVLEGATASLKAAVKDLLAQITTLQAANTVLQSALDAEIQARGAADAALQATATGLQTALNGEIAARQSTTAALSSGLTVLNSRLDSFGNLGKAYETFVPDTFLPNGNRTTVAELALPAGKYFVMAKTVVSNVEHDTPWDCQLFRNGESFPFFLDASSTYTEDVSFNSSDNITLATIATLSAPGSVRMECFSLEPASRILDVKIVAVVVQ